MSGEWWFPDLGTLIENSVGDRAMGRSQLTQEICSPAHLFAIPSPTPAPEQAALSNNPNHRLHPAQPLAPAPSPVQVPFQFQSPQPPPQPTLVPGYPRQVQLGQFHLRDSERPAVDSSYIEAQQSALPFPTGDIPSGVASYQIPFIPETSYPRPIAPGPTATRYPINPHSLPQSAPPPLSLLRATATITSAAAAAARAVELAATAAEQARASTTQLTGRLTPYKATSTAAATTATTPSIERKRNTQKRSKSSKDAKKKIYADRAPKAVATREANKEAQEKQLQLQELRQESAGITNVMPRGSPSSNPRKVASGPFREGDRVLCSSIDTSVATIVKLSDDNRNAYLHFVERDRRMDRWVSMAKISRAPVLEDEDARLVTRSRMRRRRDANPVSEKEVGNEAIAQAEREREEATKVKNVARIVFGMYELDAWYYAPFYGGGRGVECVYMCPNCLKYDDNAAGYCRHVKHCKWKQPPGACIYEDERNGIRMYEIDGIANIAYCQCLTLLGKLFLDHKTLFFDVAPFLFYVLTYNGEVAGFFSKEKPERNAEFNLACLLTLPHFQKMGLGRFLIQFSYELSRRDRKPGSPERPLSDLGQVSYRSYWKYEILMCAKEARDANEPEISVENITRQIGIRREDVIETLKSLKLLKMWKGFYSANLEDRDTLGRLLNSLKQPKIQVYPERLRKHNPVPRPPISSTIPKSSKPPKKKPRPPKRNASVLDSPSPRRPPPALRPSATAGSGPSQAVTVPGYPRTRTTPNFRTPQHQVMRNRSTPPSARRATPPTPKSHLSDQQNEGLNKAILDFCEYWGFARVIAPEDSDNGLPKSHYTAFAKNCNIPEKHARDMIKSYAHREIMNQHGKSRTTPTRPPNHHRHRHQSPSSSSSTPNKNIDKMQAAMKLNRRGSGGAAAGAGVRAKDVTPRRSGGGGGAKDVNHIAKVMAVKQTVSVSTGGMARGKVTVGVNQVEQDSASSSEKQPASNNSSVDVVNLISDESEQPTLSSVATVNGYQSRAA